MSVDKFTVRPWLRCITANIGTPKKAHNIISDGTKNGLRIDCQIHKSNISLAQPSEFSIYNLAPATREMIKQGGDIEVSAGWYNFTAKSIYKGGIRAVLNMRRGSDIITEISTGPLSFKADYAVGQWNFSPGSDIKSAAMNVAKSIPEATVAENDFSTITGKFGEGGWTATGAPQDVLLKMADEMGFQAWANDKRIQAVVLKTGEKEAGRPVYEISGDGGALIEINPIYVGAYKDGLKQVMIKSLFIPGVDPGQRVQVKSTLNPQFNKSWLVGSLDANLSAYNDQWTMTLTSYVGA